MYLLICAAEPDKERVASWRIGCLTCTRLWADNAVKECAVSSQDISREARTTPRTPPWPPSWSLASQAAQERSYRRYICTEAYRARPAVFSKTARRSVSIDVEIAPSPVLRSRIAREISQKKLTSNFLKSLVVTRSQMNRDDRRVKNID